MKPLLICALVLGVSLGIPLIGMAASTVAVPVSEDTWIDGLASTNVGGSDATLGICPRADYWIYLKFDLRAVSDRIAAAELQMRRSDGSRPEEISVYLITDDSWTETTLDGPTRPEPRDPSPDLSLALGETATGFDRWNSIAFTAAVVEEASNDGILSLMVREDPDETLDVRHYFSKEAPRPDADRPRLVLTLEAEETVAPGWIVAEVGEGTKPSFDFDEGGRIHVMAMTEEPGGWIAHASASHLEGPWSLESVATGYFYGPGDLRVDPQGTAHLAWHDHALQSPAHLSIARTGAVDRYTIDTPGLHDGWDNSLEIDSQGRLHQASVNPVSFGAHDSLQYGVFDDDEWTFQSTLITNSGPFMYGLNTSVAVDREGDPHIVYCLTSGWDTPGELRYARLDSNGWHVSTIVSNGAVGRFPTIALDHWDRPHVGWLDLDAASPGHATVRYGVLNSNEWVIEDVDTMQDVEMGFSGARKSVSIALDRNWRPHLAYSDRRRVAYATKPFDVWMRTNVVQHVDATYNGLVVLRLNEEDQPAIIFWQPQEGSVGRVRLAGWRDPRIQLFAPEFDSLTSDVHLRWTSGPEYTGYRVEGRSAFALGNWTSISGPDLLTTPHWVHTNVAGSAHMYYRVVGELLQGSD